MFWMFLHLSFTKKSVVQTQLHDSSVLFPKIPYFHLISWCGNFVERHNFRIVYGKSPETRKCLEAVVQCTLHGTYFKSWEGVNFQEKMQNKMQNAK